MQELVKEFLKQKRFAVVGSFKNEDKYAYKILRTLRNKGYEVIPVNPNKKEVDGLACYRSISDIPGAIDVADIITPPAVTEKIVKECKEKSIARVWLQPGAESKKAVKFCKDNGISVVYNLCVMLETA